MHKRKLDESMSDHEQICKLPKVTHDDILSEGCPLRYDFMTSLENIALAKICTQLWSSQQVQHEIVVHKNLKDKHGNFERIKNCVASKVSKLPLPKSVVQKLREITPHIGESVFSWVEYLDRYVFQTARRSEYSAVDQINNIAWTARGKIDHLQTAKNILGNPSNLSEDHKYKLACCYCLEDEIAVLAANIVHPDYLKSVYFDKMPMVYFRTATITGDYTKLHNPSYSDDRIYSDPSFTDMSINERIIKLLIKGYGSYNEVPIRFMWNKLSAKEKSKNITTIFLKLDNQDLRYSLLSSLDYEQQQDVFKECSRDILGDMLGNWLWGEYFLPTALHALDVIQPKHFGHVMEKVARKMAEVNIKLTEERAVHSAAKCASNKYKYIFMQLWQESPRDLKEDLKDEDFHCLEEILTVSLSWDRDMDVGQLILSELNTVERKRIMFGCYAYRYCRHLIEDSRYDLLDLFIGHFLSEEDIIELKRIVNFTGCEIVKHFVEQGAVDKAEQFMKWAMKSEEEIGSFKCSIAVSVSELFIHSDKVNFTDLEKHLKWCYPNGDLEAVNRLKVEILESYRSRKLIAKMLKECNFELLDQVLNWIFLGDELKIAQFKRNIYKDDLFLRCVEDFPFRFGDDMLDRFMDWCFTNEQEVQEFKTWVSCNLRRCCSLLLNDNRFEEADSFVTWCVNSPEEIRAFKTSSCSPDITCVSFYVKKNIYPRRLEITHRVVPSF